MPLEHISAREYQSITKSYTVVYMRTKQRQDSRSSLGLIGDIKRGKKSWHYDADHNLILKDCCGGALAFVLSSSKKRQFLCLPLVEFMEEGGEFAYTILTTTWLYRLLKKCYFYILNIIVCHVCREQNCCFHHTQLAC